MLSETNSSSLLDKLLGFDLVAITMMLLSKDEVEIREYALKFFQLLLFKSPGQFTSRFNQVGGFTILGYFVLNPKTLYYEEAKPCSDSIEDSYGPDLHVYQRVSINLMQILLDASVCRYDNVNEMSPEN